MLKDAALNYIQSGFSIIPLKSRTKLPLIKWKRFQKKKPTEQEVAQWWSRWPDANIALLTGTINNLVAFDPGFLVHQDVDRKLTLDVRGDGGYIVAPPSIHPSGAQYSWAPGLSLFETDLPDLRLWQVKYLKKNCSDVVGDPSRNLPGWEEESLKGVEEGERNDTAAKLAGRYIGKGLSDEEVKSILTTWNKKNHPPLSQTEIIVIIKSIKDQEAQKAKKAKEDRSPFDGSAGPDSLENI